MQTAPVRTIVHVDMDAFFAAVECLDHPEYRGKPLIVGGRPTDRRGVVATCSYEARAFGIRSGMPLQQARARCPQAIFVPTNPRRYRAISERLLAIFSEFTPLVEPVSIDEAFLDMTGCEHFFASPEAIGHAIKQRIRASTGLTASVGIAPNKFLAKAASDWRKPDGLVVIPAQGVQAWLDALPIDKLWGVGRSTRAILARHGIHTVRQLRERPRSWLIALLGKHGEQLHELAHGIDRRAVEPPGEAKSIGHEITFETDLYQEADLLAALGELVAAVGRRLRRDGRAARTVSLKARYRDFTTITRAVTLSQPITADDSLYETVRQLLHRVPKTAPFRLLGVYVSDLVAARQLSLFDDPRKERLSEVLDAVNAKFERRVLWRGRERAPLGRGHP